MRLAKLFTAVTVLLSALVLVAMALTVAPVQSRPVEDAKLRELITLTGLDSGLNVFQQAVVQGFAQASRANPNREALVAAATEAAASAFAPEKLKTKQFDALKAAMSEADIEQVFLFYRSPLAARMTALENAAQTMEVHAKIEGSRAELEQLLATDKSRAQAIDAIDKSLSISESTVEMALNLQRAVVYGMAAADGRQNEVPVDELIEKGRAQLAEPLTRQTRLAMAYTYRDANLEDLKEYVAYLSSAPGQKLYQTVRGIKTKLFLTAGLEFGETLATKLRVQRL